MRSGEIISSFISGLMVVMFAAVSRALLGLRKDFRRFMAEHVWLIATSMWTRDKVVGIMRDLNMPIDDPPPDNLK